MLRLLLLFYPTKFRRDWGPEILVFWRLQAVEPRYRGLLGSLRLAIAVGRDAVMGGIRIRVVNWRTRKKSREGVESMWRSVRSDLAYAMRSLRGSPLFSLVVIGTLALGIGTTGAGFSVVDKVLLQPLPFPEPESLVQVLRTMEEGKTQSLSWPDYRDYREHAGGYVDLTAYVETQTTVPLDGGAEALDGAGVAREFFSVMGVQPLMGRTFTPEEDQMGGPRAVVLSYRYWDQFMGRDPNVLEETMPMGEEEVPIVGVMPRGFSFPLRETWFWTPLREDELLAQVGLPTGVRTLHFLQGLGRVRSNVDIQEAESRLRTLANTIDVESGMGEDIHSDIHFIPLKEGLLGDVDTLLTFLFGAAALVLLVACANVAGLAFSRMVSRERELAIRSALGAREGRLLRQLLSENLLLSLSAGGAGILVALGVQRALLELVPPDFVDLEGLAINPATLLFVGVVTVLSGLAFGFLPALGASRTNLARGLSGGRGSSAGSRALRPQQLLVTLQVSLAVVLLVAATLLTSSFLRLTGVHRGFEAESVLVATVDPSTDRYDTPEAVDGFYRALLDRIRTIPGVTAASTTYSPPLMDNGFQTSVLPEGLDEEATEAYWAGMVIIREGYFEANGVPLLQGREFDSGDRLGGAPVAIVSQAMAENLWPGEDPLGKRFSFAGGVGGSAESFDEAFFPDDYYTVVGVAGNVRRRSLAEAPAMEYYRPHTQVTWAYQYLVVRTEGDPVSLAGTLRETVWEVDSTVPVRTVQSLEAQVQESIAVQRFQTLLLLTFGGLSCFLAMVGLYVVTALAVNRRTREVGIRLALGAREGVILRDVLLRGLLLVAFGLAAGLAMALAGSKLLAGMLFQVQSTDPMTYLAVSLLTATVALLACYAPAKRASVTDPLLTLKED